MVAYYVYFNGNYVYPASIYIYEGFEALGLAGVVKYSAALLIIVLAIFIIYRVRILKTHLKERNAYASNT